MPRKKFVAHDPRAGKGPKKGAKNAGRPPNAIRAAMRAALSDRIQIAIQIIDAADASPAQQLAALDFLAKFGLGPRQQRQRVEVTGKNGGPVETTQTLVFGDKEIAF